MLISKELQVFLIAQLGRVYYKWPARSECKKRARRKIGTYSTGRDKFAWECAKCKGLFKASETQVDHIKPKVPVEGYASGLLFDLVEFVLRLFCDVSGLQNLCIPCHLEKSTKENGGRAEVRKIRKSGKNTPGKILKSAKIRCSKKSAKSK